jgi:precorrin-4 methylase
MRYFLPVLVLMGAAVAHAGQGKFYIVGMGTAKDLITVRALEVIKSADIILMGTDGEDSPWQEYLKGKEVWPRPIALRVFYGADPEKIADPQQRARAEKGIKARKELVDRVTAAVREGKIVADLQGGDPMIFGLTFMLEQLPKDIPTEVVPGVGAFQAASAAVKMSPPFGYDTSGVILTMDDWEGRVDVNEKLMAAGSTMVVYTMMLRYERLFDQLKKHYPADTPVAAVIDAGDRQNQKVLRSTVGRFIDEIDYKNLPNERLILLIGKFLEVGMARKDFVPEVSGGHAPLP